VQLCSPYESVKRVVTHQAIAVATQVGDTDVIAPDDEDVGLLGVGI
jgi:hypothetical protein